MRLICPQDSENHKLFRRVSYNIRGDKLNEDIVDEFERFVGDPLDLYTGDVVCGFFCVGSGSEAILKE